MRFGILGPVQVVDGYGREIVLRSRTQRALLAALLIRANEVVSTDRLIDELWGEQPPASAAKALQVHVSRLRRALGSDGAETTALVTHAGGYLLRVAADELDSTEFERLVEAGKRLIAEDGPREAADRIREALDLWRGPVLADVTSAEFAQAEIRRLEELRLSAVIARIDAELALGAGAELVGDLEQLVIAEPFQERVRGQLMRALYQAGRQADALELYRQTSELLRDELGLEPSRELQEIERSILQHDATLQPVSPADTAPRANLPQPATAFVGRAAELAEVTEMLKHGDVRLITLTGAGGSGKTRLALRVAEVCASEYTDGVWFVDFSDISDPELIPSTI
jgi:DNA-binding SARP family transcriptional activator